MKSSSYAGLKFFATKEITGPLLLCESVTGTSYGEVVRVLNENGEERTNIVTLVDDEGNEHEFAVIDIFPVDLKQYAILVPVNYETDQEDEEGFDLTDDAYIFRIDVDEASGDETLVEVEDEAEWNQVALEWETRVQNMDEEEGELL